MNPPATASTHPPPTLPANTISSKQELVDAIKEWFQLETEIETLRKELNTRQQRKRNIDTLLNNVFEHLKPKEGINIPAKKGKLVQIVKERKKPITKKMLLSHIQTFFQAHAQEGIPNMTDHLMQHLLSHRETIRQKKIEFEVLEDASTSASVSVSATTEASASTGSQPL